MKKILFFGIIIFTILGFSIYYNIESEVSKDTREELIYLSSFYNKTNIPNKLITKTKDLYWINKNSFLGEEFRELQWDYYKKTKSFGKNIFKWEELKGGIFFNSIVNNIKNTKTKKEKDKKIISFLKTLNILESFSIGEFFYSDVDYSFLKIEKLGEGFIKKEKNKINFYFTTEFKGNSIYSTFYYECTSDLNNCAKKNNYLKNTKVKKEDLVLEQIYFINFN